MSEENISKIESASEIQNNFNYKNLYGQGGINRGAACFDELYENEIKEDEKDFKLKLMKMLNKKIVIDPLVHSVINHMRSEYPHCPNMSALIEEHTFELAFHLIELTTKEKDAYKEKLIANELNSVRPIYIKIKE